MDVPFRCRPAYFPNSKDLLEEGGETVPYSALPHGLFDSRKVPCGCATNFSPGSATGQ